MFDTCVVRTYHDNEQTKLKEEYFYNNGKIEGIYKLYYYSGELKLEVSYVNGKKHGLERKYYRNGVLHWEYIFNNNKIIESKEYNENGELNTYLIH